MFLPDFIFNSGKAAASRLLLKNGTSVSGRAVPFLFCFFFPFIPQPLFLKNSTPSTGPREELFTSIINPPDSPSLCCFPLGEMESALVPMKNRSGSFVWAADGGKLILDCVNALVALTLK